jgi:hypothetical protein
LTRNGTAKVSTTRPVATSVPTRTVVSVSASAACRSMVSPLDSLAAAGAK